MATGDQIFDYDTYEFTMTDVTGKKFSVAMNHCGSSEELEEFFTLVAKAAGFNWVKNVYMIPTTEDLNKLAD